MYVCVSTPTSWKTDPDIPVEELAKVGIFWEYIILSGIFFIFVEYAYTIFMVFT